jgi:filamentous hemagglutinin family protein
VVAAAAGVTVDVGAPVNNQASIASAQNGVPVVNIAAPTSKGVSHNKYTQFDIDTQGLILNNGLSASETQLGGQINANPNLSGSAASIILNEVTSTNASQLNGVAEIAGQSAEFILANPNGITCAGCGFINTPRATLTTGVPNLLNDDLQGFTVSDGRLVINGRDGIGLDGTNIDRLDLLSRAIEINDKVFAKEINLITGRNEIDYADLQTTALAATAESDATQSALALDVSAIGGMYANQIFMLGTEEGLGVHMAGEMASSAGDITISANGDLTLNKVVAGKDLNITASGDPDTQFSTLLVADDALLQAGNNLNIDFPFIVNFGYLVADNNLAINTLDLENYLTGRIHAGGNAAITAFQIYNFSHSQSFFWMDDYYEGDLDYLTSNDFSSGQGTITADGNLDLMVLWDIANSGIIAAGGNLTASAERIFNNRGRPDESGYYDFNDIGEWYRQFDSTGAILFAAGDINLWVDELNNNRSEIYSIGQTSIASDSDLNYAYRIENEAGTIEALDGLIIASEYLINNRGMANSFCYDCFGGFLESNPDHHVFDIRWFYNEAADYRDWLLDYAFDNGLDIFGSRSDIWDVMPAEVFNRYESYLDNPRSVMRESQILSSTDITLNVDELWNEGSSISALNNLNVSANRVANLSPTLLVEDAGDGSVGDLDFLQGYTLTHKDIGDGIYYVEVDFSGRLLAGNSINITTGTLVNKGENTQGGNLDSVVVDDPNSATGASFEQELAERQQLALAEPFSWLDTQPAPQPDPEPSTPPQNVLIATNESVARFVNALGSDYLLELLNIDPDQITKRLGDGFYETRLVRQAIADSTGKRFLDESISSDRQQFKALMDNAAKASQDLQLSVGISLSSEQIAALQQDIVWLVERVVNGETVLVPTLYLAQTNDAQEAPNHNALIAANNITITATGQIVNKGSIEAANDAQLVAGDELLNDGGRIQATNLTLATTEGNITNRSRKDEGDSIEGRIVADDNLSVNAAQDILHQGGVINANGFADFEAGRDVVVTANGLDIKGDARIHADRDISLIGAEVNFENNAELSSGRDVQLISVTEYKGSRSDEGRWLDRYKQIRETKKVATYQEKGAELNADGNLTLVSGGDLSLKGSTLAVSGDANLDVGGDVDIQAAHELQRTTETIYRKYSSERPSFTSASSSSSGAINRKVFVGGEKIKANGQKITETYTAVGSELAIDGNLSLVSGDDLTIKGSTLNVDGNAQMDVGGKLGMQTAQDHQKVTTMASP